MINLPIHFIVLMEALRDAASFTLIFGFLFLVILCVLQIFADSEDIESKKLTCLIRAVVMVTLVSLLLFLFIPSLGELAANHVISQSTFNMLIH